jgi:hypothetical protein
MIQRITRDTTSGDTSVDFRVERKVKTGLGVVECNDSRWRVQSGILAGYDVSGVEDRCTIRSSSCQASR